jgi:hypothetical protein
MEYLITYGWAIIIIGVTLAALYALGLFSPASFTSNQCIFPADFGCLSSFLYATNGTLSINLEQSTTSAINVAEVGCNTGGTVSNMTTTNDLPIDTTPSYIISNTYILIPIGGNFTLTTTCYANGNVFTSQPGTLYKGYVVVNYTNVQTGFQHVLVGKLVEKTT